LDKGAKLPVNELDKQNLMVLSCASGDTASVKQLISDHIDPNIPNKNGQLGFIEAARNSQIEMVKLLISYKADKDVQDLEGNTPIHYACLNGNLPLALELIKAQAKPDLSNKAGIPPLFYAAQSGNYDLLLELVRLGSKLTTLDLKKNNILHHLLKTGIRTDLNEKRDYQSLQVTMVQYFINKTVPLNTTNSFNEYPLTILGKYRLEENGTRILTLLLSQQIDTAHYISGMLAGIGNNSIGFVEKLLAKNINIQKFATPLIFGAIKKGDDRIFQLLINQKIDINGTESGYSPLLYALTQRKWAISNKLIQAGAQLDFVSEKGAVIDYAMEPAIRDIFYTSLLRNQLVYINGLQGVDDFQRIDLKKFDDNNNVVIPDMKYTLSGYFDNGKRVYDPNAIGANYEPKNKFVVTSQKRQGNKVNVSFLTRPYWIAPARKPSDKSYVNWQVAEEPWVIPAADFHPQSNTTVYPKVVIRNTSTTRSLVIAQEADIQLSPGDSILMDRSIGPIKVKFENVRMRILDYSFEVSLNQGPAIPTQTDFSLGMRYQTYAQLYKWKLLSESRDSTGYIFKTYRTAMHVLSEKSIVNRYVQAIKLTIDPLLKDIQASPKQLSDLRKFYFFHNELNPESLNELLTKLDALLKTDLTAEQKIHIQEVRKDLAASANSSALSDTYLKLYTGSLFTQLQEKISSLQVHLMELAQYIPLEKLSETVHLTDRSTRQMAEVIIPEEIFIKDGDINGKGKYLKQILGIKK
jgi:ankyrin repeat protein